MKKTVSLLLALTLCLSLLPAALALEPVVTNNQGQHNYGTRSHTVDSYLYDNGSGLTRVENTRGKGVVVEDYSADFQLLSRRTIREETLYFEGESLVFGGFYAGEKYNFLIFGQYNYQEYDDLEVFRVVKYDKAWNRMGSVSLFGANTIAPFDAGSLRCDEYGGYLYVHTCHEMFRTDDGKNHQANLTFCVREEDMEITDSFFGILNTSVGYVSHSFNQFILVDRDGYIVTADHGDGHPRAHVLLRYPTKAGSDKFVPTGSRTTAVELVNFPGAIGENETGSALGGLAETDQGYVVAYNWDGGDSGHDRDLYLAFVDRDMQLVQTATLPVPGGASTPVLAPTGPEGGYLLWTSGANLSYAAYDARGNLGEVKTVPGCLSDCQPIPYKGGLVWYVTEKYAPVFYTLTDAGLQVSSDEHFIFRSMYPDVLTGYEGPGGNLVIPGNATSIDKQAFQDCTSLTGVTIPNSVTSIGDKAFQNCTSLTGVTIFNGMTSIGSEAFSGCTALTSVTIPNSVTSIGTSAFYNCSSLTSAVIPDGVTSINFNMFQNCTALTSVSIPDSVTSIGWSAFHGCSSLTAAAIPDGVTDIGFATFADCTSLTAVTIPASVTHIGDNAFSGCPNLTIYGAAGSYAQTFAKQKGIHFVAGPAPVSAAPPAPVVPTAYASTQSVLVDGSPVEFQCYALKDAAGNDTNYIKLRDVASVLGGTPAQFNVGWDGAVNIETGKAYAPNGSEMKTPFSGSRAYEPATAETRVNGAAANLDAIVLKDDAGGAYTYYKLRDLGTFLGFTVDWSAEKGIFIETK